MRRNLCLTYWESSRTMMWLRLIPSLILLIPSWLTNWIFWTNWSVTRMTLIIIFAATCFDFGRATSWWNEKTYTITCLNDHLWVAEVGNCANWWLASLPSLWVNRWFRLQQESLQLSRLNLTLRSLNEEVEWMRPSLIWRPVGTWGWELPVFLRFVSVWKHTHLTFLMLKTD